MTLNVFLFAWLFSTIAMTVFSTIYSGIVQKQFQEPILLAGVIALNSKQKTTFVQRNPLVLGWAIHIALGAVFLGLYELLWIFSNLERTVLNSLFLGSFMGFLGILGWKFLFKTINYAFKINYLHYYIHLFLAHIVFSVVAVIIYQMAA